MNIRFLKPSEYPVWNAFVRSHEHGTIYHCAEWQSIIARTYGHRTCYLLADRAADGPQEPSICGILPLVHMKSLIFGNNLVSMPFMDRGGILAEDSRVERQLLHRAVQIAKDLKASNLELRQTDRLPALKSLDGEDGDEALSTTTFSHKVSMILDLPPSSEQLMQSFKSKLRSQIKKPVKEGLYSKVGGLELLNDFYRVFLVNMRDLGSPVHSKELLGSVLDAFEGRARICMVYKEGAALAGSVILRFKNRILNPWASSLKEYSRLSPNMLLYWTMLEYACENGCTSFDFGRSSPDEGTYKFKEQWGAKPQPLHWHSISLNGSPQNGRTADKSKFDAAIHCWKKLPVSFTKIIGPPIRKYIGL